MATALYRRYRPESFAEVIGQDHVTEPLRRALNSGRVGHAYLFSGPRGCGKTTSARILARCLNCAEGPTDTPCGVCDSCRDLARGGSGSLDVVEIDAASHGGVDDARELRERAAFAPVRDRYKVFIIDEAHMVTSAGFNALLKLVEEPPEHVKFIFATTEPDKVIGTIRSRTHHYPFRLIPPQVLLPYLEEICREENVHVAEGVLALAARAGGGSARDTLSVLDQLIAGSDARGVELEIATNLLGFTNVELMNRAVDAVAARDAAALFTAVDEVIGSGHEPRRFVEDLLERFRDLIVVVAAPERSRELLPDVPVDQVERLIEQSGRFEPRELTDCAHVVNDALNSMVGATSPRLHLELLAARLVLRGTAQGGQAAPAGGIEHAVPAAARGTSRTPSAAEDGLTPRQRAERAARGTSAPQSGTETASPVASAPVSAPAPAPASAPAAASTAANAPAPAVAPAPVVEPAKPVAEASGQSETAEQWAAAIAPAQAQPHAEPTPAPTPAKAPNAERPQAAPISANTGESRQVSAHSKGSVEDVQGHWSALMDALQTIKRASWALIAQNASVDTFDGAQLVLRFQSQGLVNAFYRGNHAQMMAEAVQKIMRTSVSVEATAGGEPPRAAHSGPNGGNSAPARAHAPAQAPAPVQSWGDALDSGNGPASEAAAAWAGEASALSVAPPRATETPAAPEWNSAAETHGASWGNSAIEGNGAPERPTAPESHAAPQVHSADSHWGFAAEEPAGQANTARNIESAPQAAQVGAAFDAHDAPPHDDWDQIPPDPYDDPFEPAQEHWAPHETVSEPRESKNNVERSRSVEIAESAPASGDASNGTVHGNVAAVTIAPQPAAGEPRTHGQEDLRNAMRAAYAGSGFEPAPSLIESHGGSSSAAPAAAEETSAPRAQEAAPSSTFNEAPGATAAAESALTGAALARQALHEAQAKSSARNGARTQNPDIQSTETTAPENDDPFGGASLDDADATGIGTNRRPGREILEEFLGAEVLEVIDESNNPAGY